MSDFLRVARGNLRAVQFQELELAWKKRGERIEELETELARLKAGMQELNSVVAALDVVCAARALPRRLYDSLAFTRDELRSIARRALGEG